MTKMRLLFAVVLVCSLSASDAADPKTSTNAPLARTDKPKLPQGMPFYGKVGAIDKMAQTITLDGKEKKRIFHLSPSTRIHRDKQAARLEDVVIGQWVGGFVRPDGEGRPMVMSLNLAVVQKTPAGSRK